MVEIFKTNLDQQEQANRLLSVLTVHFPLFRINFDLDDCDRILRVEGDGIAHTSIIDLVVTNGYACEVLD